MQAKDKSLSLSSKRENPSKQSFSLSSSSSYVLLTSQIPSSKNQIKINLSLSQTLSKLKLHGSTANHHGRTLKSSSTISGGLLLFLYFYFRSIFLCMTKSYMFVWLVMGLRIWYFV
ncbi:hypothetical protein ACB098_04G049700 [Castanea mollissima]